MANILKSIQWKQLGNHFVAGLAAFLLIAGANIIVHDYLLQSTYATLEGIYVSSALFSPVFLLVMLMLTFFVVELNRKIPESSIAIGLVLGIVYSLPTFLNGFNLAIPISITTVTIIANIVGLTLASHVFVLIRK